MIKVVQLKRLKSISLDEAFDYIVDFTNLPNWDLNALRSQQVDGTGITKGSRYQIDYLFLGKKLSLISTIEELKPPTHAFLRTSSKSFDVKDIIELTSASKTDTTIRYTVELSFCGKLRLLEPIVKPFLARSTEKALTGLQAAITSHKTLQVGKLRASE